MYFLHVLSFERLVLNRLSELFVACLDAELDKQLPGKIQSIFKSANSNIILSQTTCGSFDRLCSFLSM